MAKYFSPKEFTACTPSCDISQMDAAFLAKLDEVRDLAGIPLVLNSAYRSPAYEKSKGRAGTSAHCRGMAADIRCNSDRNRYLILRAAIRAGIDRIGIGKTFIHLDTSGAHTPCVCWHYYE